MVDVVGMHAARASVPIKRLARLCMQRGAGRVDVEDAAVEIDEGDAQRRVLERGAEPLFGFPVRAFRPLALGDVAGVTTTPPSTSSEPRFCPTHSNVQ